MSVLDISNYDYDWDIRNPRWASDFKSAGVGQVIVGTQWDTKARYQCDQLLRAGIAIWGTYVESNGDLSDMRRTVELNLAYDLRRVAVVVEPGGVTSLVDLRRNVQYAEDMKQRVYIYGNQSDLMSVIGAGNTEFSRCGLWLANYGTNNPQSPRPPITEVNFCGWTSPSIHQYSSTIVISGRNRDHNYILEEPTMASAEYDRLVRVLTGYPSGHPEAERQLDDWNAKGNSLLAGYAIEQADQDALEAAAEEAEAAVETPVQPLGMGRLEL